MSKVIGLWRGMTGTVLPFAGSTAPSEWLMCDGSAVSRATYPNLFKLLVTDAGFTAQTFTVTVASPGLFTKTAHGFTGGERLRLSTTGALPTGLSTSTDYFVEYVSANTFYLQNAAGTRINTTGTQSGTHSYVRSIHGLGDGSTTFNVPDIRGEFIRGLDAGRGVDASRVLGAPQGEGLQRHNHYLPTTTATSTTNIGAAIMDTALDITKDINTQPSPGTNIVTVDINGVQNGPAPSGTQGAWAGETRPRNVALNHIIKT
jgi:microcystin-dependent protein